jgi:hypothetical protein
MRDEVAATHQEIYGEAVADGALTTLLAPTPGSTWPLSPKATTGATPPSEPYRGPEKSAVNSSSPHAKSVAVQPEATVASTPRARVLGVGVAVVAAGAVAFLLLRHGTPPSTAPPPPLSVAASVIPPPSGPTTDVVESSEAPEPIGSTPDASAAPAASVARPAARRPLTPPGLGQPAASAAASTARPVDRFDHQ